MGSRGHLARLRRRRGLAGRPLTLFCGARRRAATSPAPRSACRAPERSKKGVRRWWWCQGTNERKIDPGTTPGTKSTRPRAGAVFGRPTRSVDLRAPAPQPPSRPNSTPPGVKGGDTGGLGINVGMRGACWRDGVLRGACWRDGVLKGACWRDGVLRGACWRDGVLRGVCWRDGGLNRVL